MNRRAHDADPEAQLFYNDYEIEAGKGNPKSGSAYRFVKRMKDASVPIHGIGMQMHVDPRHWPSGTDPPQRRALRSAGTRRRTHRD